MEGVALRSIDDLLSQPHPDHMSSEALVQELIAAIKNAKNRPLCLKGKVASKALGVLNTGTAQLMLIKFKGKNFFEVLVSVWIVIRGHKDRDEMTKRLAEEVAEGVGMCAGGRVGRLINSLRGFMDIGGQTVVDSSELMQAAFSRRVLKEGLSQEQRLEEAEAVLKEFGVIGENREAWLEGLREYQ